MSGYGGSVNSGHRGPVSTEDQRNGGNIGIVGTEDQWKSGYRGPVGTGDQRKSGNRGPVGTEDWWVQRTSRYRGAECTEDQLVRGLVGTVDLRNSG